MEEKRAALVQIVDRGEFNPATGEGRVHHHVRSNGASFQLDTAARELGLETIGIGMASPRRSALRAAAVEWDWMVAAA